MNNQIEKEKQIHELVESFYKLGYTDGYTDGKNDVCGEVREQYIEQGRKEAWECARKIAEREDDMRNCFHDIAPSEIFGRFSASEAIVKIKEYEHKQDDEIKVGDEIVLNDLSSYIDCKAVVLNDDKSSYPYEVLVGDGDTEWITIEAVKCKTGKYYPQIVEVLEQLKGETEE